MHNKKSQIQIGETVAVLFIFFILIVIGLVFYLRVAKTNLESDIEESQQLNSIGIAQRIMFLPELQCSEDNIIKENCIDELKLNFAAKLMQENQLYYFDIFEFSDINIGQVYPESAVEWNIYSRKLEKYTSKFSTNIPLTLYDPVTRRHSFGVLSIETYVR